MKNGKRRGLMTERIFLGSKNGVRRVDDIVSLAHEKLDNLIRQLI